MTLNTDSERSLLRSTSNEPAAPDTPSIGSNGGRPFEVEICVHELIVKRRSAVWFSEREVDTNNILSLLEAARWAPSSFNEQPWSFILAIKSYHPEAHRQMVSCLSSHNSVWAHRAPVLLLTLAEVRWDRIGGFNRHAMHDVGLAMGNLELQATSIGLSVHQMGGFNVERARLLFEIPDSCELVTISAIGYEAADANPFNPPDLTRSRKPLSSFVFTGRWGEAFSSRLPSKE